MENTSADQIWDDFCLRFSVIKNAVPLFEVNASGRVATRRHGHDGRTMLCRSEQMESLVRTEAAKAVSDFQAGGQQIDGLIHMMGWIEKKRFIPLYICKTQTSWQGGKTLSHTLRNLDKNKLAFSHWGDSYQYNFGALSAYSVPGHNPRDQRERYRDWANTLFEQVPTEHPILRRPVWLWTTAWDNRSTGIWKEVGPTRLSFLEDALIGVAGMISPVLLNCESVNRA